MDELTKLFEAIAKEKTRTLDLQKEEVLKQVKKTEKKNAHRSKVKEDFWGVFKSELKKLSEEEEQNKNKAVFIRCQKKAKCEVQSMKKIINNYYFIN